MNLTKDDYSRKLVRIMIEKSYTMSEAIEFDFDQSGVDKDNVFDITDYMEAQLEQDMSKVSYFIEVYFGTQNDLILRKI